MESRPTREQSVVQRHSPGWSDVQRVHFVPFLSTEIERREDDVSVRDVGESAGRRERKRVVVWMVFGNAHG